MYTGPNIVNEGLVFGIDSGYGIANTGVPTRHFKGKPTTNLASGLVKTFGSWSNLQGSTEYYTRGGSQGVHLIVTGNGGVQWHGSDQINSVSASTQYTISATIKWTGVTPHTNLFYIRQYNSSSSQVSESGQFSTSYMIDLGDGWYRAYRTFTTTSTTDYVRIQGYQYDANANIYYQDEQFELGSLTPYAGDGAARSNTASLIDLKRTVNVDLSNVSFNAMGQPTFDGTDDRVDMGDTSLTDFGTGNFTIEAVLYIPSDITTNTGHYKGVVIKKGASSANAGMGIYYNTGHEKFLWSTANGSSAVERFTNNTFGSLLGTYMHVVMVRDSSATNNGHFYINGVHEAISSGGSLMDVDNNYNLLVGASSTLHSTYFLEGSVPVAKIYNTALTATEIKSNFNAYKNRFNI